MVIAIVDVGGQDYNQIREYYQSVGYKVDWYVFPEDIPEQELLIEIRDLGEFYDFFWLPTGVNADRVIPEEKIIRDS
jgi:hypothetical protein